MSRKGVFTKVKDPQSKPILWVTENFPPQEGGMARSCFRIVSGLKESGFCIDLLHLKRHGKSKQGGNSTTGYHLTLPFIDPIPHSLLMTEKKILSLNRDYFSVVGFGGFISLHFSSILSKLQEVPLVTLLRGNDFDTALYDLKKWTLLKGILEGSHTVVTVDFQREQRIKKLFPGRQTLTIPNGINPELWNPTPSEIQKGSELKKEISKGKKILGMFGFLKEKKGFDLLLKARKMAGLEEKILLLLVGEIKNPQTLEKTRGETLNIHRFPVMKGRKIIPYYLACDGFILPSLYDGFPNTLLEAAVLKIPILGSEVGGIADFLSHLPDRFLFPPNDPLACSETLEKWVKTPTRILKKLGQQAHLLAKEKFPHLAELARYQSLFQNLNR